MEESSRQGRNGLEALARAVAGGLAQGKPKSRLVEDLVPGGMAQDTAVAFVDNVEAELDTIKSFPETRSREREVHTRRMLSGLIWTAVGAVVTIVTFRMAQGGGTYFVAYGAIIFGLFDFFRGLLGWLNTR